MDECGNEVGAAFTESETNAKEGLNAKVDGKEARAARGGRGGFELSRVPAVGQGVAANEQRGDATARCKPKTQSGTHGRTAQM